MGSVGVTELAPYGNRLIPQIIDDLASAEPGRVLYSVAKSSDISQGLRDVSARAFTEAVDKTAWLLRRELGESPEIRAVGYIGPREFFFYQGQRIVGCLGACTALLALSSRIRAFRLTTHICI